MENFDCFGCDFASNVSMDDTYTLCSLQTQTTFCSTIEDASHLSEEPLLGNHIFGCTESAITRTLSKSCMSFIKFLLTHQNIGIAVCTIVSHVAHGTKRIDHHHIMNIDKADFILFLEMAQLVTKIGSLDREQFCRILSMYKKHSYSHHCLPLPTTLTRCCRIVLRNDCAYSLLKLLPLPSVIDDNKGHTYITLLSFLQHALLFPSKPKNNNNNQALLKSVYATKIISQCKVLIPGNMYSTSLIALIICWFDDWDASTALMKANKNSVFSGVNTVIFVTTSGEYYGSYTNVTCVGKKQGNHQSVINEMLLDLNKMETKKNAKTLFSVIDNTWYTVQPAFLYLIADQPARRGLCGMLAGNSKLHPCFGYSMHILALSKPFAACKTCKKSLFEDVLPLSCKSCLCWELPSRNNPPHMK